MDDEEIQAGLIDICKNDLLFFVRTFVWQFNPDLREVGPFIPWPFQEAAMVGGDVDLGGIVRRQHGLVECIEDRESVRWQKSRYVGASWVALITGVWLSLFHDNIKILMLSRDEKTAEESDNPDSLFWKVKFIVEHLPGWLVGGTSAGGVKSKKGIFKFLRNGNTITTSANVESAGVGGRATLLLIDEFGQFDKGHEIYSMTSDTSDCRVFIFTHKGRNTMAYDLCFDARYAGMRDITTHWTQHPEKRKGLYRYVEETNQIEVLDKEYKYDPDFEFVMSPKPTGGPCPGLRSPWYDKRCENRSEYDIAMNLDIDPTGSSLTFFDAYKVAVLKSKCVPAYWQGNLIYDDATAEPIALEADPLGLLKLWVTLKGDARLPVMRAGAGVDISSGTGHSPSVLVVWNADTGEKVLQYASANILQHDFARLVVAALRMIVDHKGIHPLMGYEIQYSGAFDKIVQQQLKYTRVYQYRHEDKKGRPFDAKGRAGLNMSKAQIRSLMEDYRIALYEEKIRNYDVYALDELMQFVYVGDYVEYKKKSRKRGERDESVLSVESGASVYHGDVVRADCIGYKMLTELGFETAQRSRTHKEPPKFGTLEWRMWWAEAEQDKEEEVAWS